MPAVMVYLFLCAALAADHFSEGFVALRPSGLTVQVRNYVRNGGTVVLNVGQIKGLPADLIGVHLTDATAEANNAVSSMHIPLRCCNTSAGSLFFCRATLVSPGPVYGILS